jgi:hypothetical protein
MRGSIMAVQTTNNQRETEVVSENSNFNFHYVRPNDANDLKREGRTLRIRSNSQRRAFTLNGREINTLKRILQESGEI